MPTSSQSDSVIETHVSLAGSSLITTVASVGVWPVSTAAVLSAGQPASDDSGTIPLPMRVRLVGVFVRGVHRLETKTNASGEAVTPKLAVGLLSGTHEHPAAAGLRVE